MRKFVCFRKLPERENFEKNQQYTSKHLRSNAISALFLFSDLDRHFRYQMFKIFEMRPFSYVTGS